jgi:3-oxoacyl-[acyl-carrier-protein] synthase II
MPEPHAKPVAITGIGIITSLGAGREENWAKLRAGQSGIHRITRFPIDHLKTSIAGSVDFMPVDPVSAPALSHAMAQSVVREAIAQSGLNAAPRKGFPGPLFLAAPPVEVEWSNRFNLAHRRPGGASNYAELLEAATQDSGELHEDFMFGAIGERLADEFGTSGAPITLTTACASGASAIQLGVEAIRRGEARAALCVGTDGSIQAEALIRFSLLSALSTANDAPEEAAKPFAKNRDGFVMAEGAAALVLEDPDAARARGATILALLRGCGEAADTFHRTRSHPSGDAIFHSMARAIEDSGLKPEEIDYINAHGTGTPENDKMETLGVQRVFGEHANALAISSNKSMIGHTLTAAGAVEAAFSVLTLRDQILPPTINYRVPDPAITLDVVPNQARSARVRTVLSNSFGFGGQNVSLVLSLPV